MLKGLSYRIKNDIQLSQFHIKHLSACSEVCLIVDWEVRQVLTF